MIAHTNMNETRLSFDELVAALRAGSVNRGELRAITLLVEHRHWLTAADVQPYIVVSTEPDDTGGLVPAIAVIRWHRLARKAHPLVLEQQRLQGTASDLAVLDIVLSLACGLPIDLGRTLLYLDGQHVEIALTAIKAAAAESAWGEVEKTPESIPDLPFKVGDRVRNRQTRAILTVTEPVRDWEARFYEHARPESGDQVEVRDAVGNVIYAGRLEHYTGPEAVVSIAPSGLRIRTGRDRVRLASAPVPIAGEMP